MAETARTELRTDILTSRQVIVASGRGERPNAAANEPILRSEFDPFLPGNESETPAERYALRDSETRQDQPGWRIRVVPNRYPIVTERETAQSSSDSLLFPRQASTGLHDVVIECPDGRTQMLDLSEEEFQILLEAWQCRIRQIQRDPQINDIIVFRNEGFSAGASLPHCHSQIVGFHQESPGLRARRRAESDYQVSCGRGLTQDWLQAELRKQERIVSSTDSFVAVCPFAPCSNFHMRLLQRTEELRFEQLAPEQRNELARMLRNCLFRLRTVTGGCSFNLLLPICGQHHAVQFPWMIEIVPRVSRVAGWELLTDIDVVTVAPEFAAGELRAASEEG